MSDIFNYTIIENSFIEKTHNKPCLICKEYIILNDKIAFYKDVNNNVCHKICYDFYKEKNLIFVCPKCKEIILYSPFNIEISNNIIYHKKCIIEN